MLFAIDNTPRPYAWGVPGEISRLRDRAERSEVEAELWLGTHPTSSATVVAQATPVGADTASTASVVGRPLSEALEAEGEPPRLGFLLKVLAVGQPLSIQVHPDAEQAQAGFAREERESGLPADDPQRNYHDPFAKPEMVLALSDEFELFAGFRDPAEIAADLRAFEDRAGAAHRDVWSRAGALLNAEDDGLSGLLSWALSPAHRDAVAAAVVAGVEGRKPPLRAGESSTGGRRLEAMRQIVCLYPDDPGAFVSLLLNFDVLAEGQASFLPARSIHFYVRGIGVELMGPSDNVLRCGLTPKRVDVPELLRIVDPAPSRAVRLSPVAVHPAAEGVGAYTPPEAPFELVRAELSEGETLVLPSGADSLLFTLGTGGRLRGGSGELRLAPGDAAAVTASERGPVFESEGDGELYLAHMR